MARLSWKSQGCGLWLSLGQRVRQTLAAVPPAAGPYSSRWTLLLPRMLQWTATNTNYAHHPGNFTKEDKWMANTHTEGCLTSLVFSEMQIEPTMRYRYVPTRITLKRSTTQSIVEDTELETWYPTWECKVVCPLWKAVWFTLIMQPSNSTPR